MRFLRHRMGYGYCLMPPYVITPDEIDSMVNIAAAGIDRVTA